MTQLWIGILLASAAGAPAGPERVLESVVPGLAYGPACRSVVELANLGGRSAAVEVEGHRANGALVSAGAANPVVLAPGGRALFRLAIEEETSGAWVKVRERIPSPDQGPVVAAHGTTECLDGDRLRTVGRDVAFPMRNPWFAEEVGAPAGGVIAFINAGERPADAAVCYSAGNLYSMPRRDRGPPPLEPLCSEAFAAQIPPFGSREFPLERNGNRWFSIRTRGPSIALQMLRPVEAGVRMYVVDSTIEFGSEVPPPTSR